MKKTYILAMVIFTLATLSATAQDTFSYKSGNNEIILLSETQGNGNKNILIDAPEEVLEKYIPDGTFPNAVNAFLIKRGGKNILVDTGYGTTLFDNLRTVGVEPEEVDEVILTHMHGDHIGGLMKDGVKTFPNAKLTIGQLEHDYWTSDEQMNNVAENRRGAFMKAREVITVYGDNLDLKGAVDIASVSPDDCGIHIVSAYGHTPGHVGVMVVCCGNRLLIWGDLTHAMAVQMPHPGIAVTYDVQPDIAVKSRLIILEYVAGQGIPIAGMHIPYPGIGTVNANSERGYIFTPAE